MTLLTFSEFKKAYASRHEPEHYVHFARMFWTLLLFVTSVFILMGIVFGAWQFIFLKGDVRDVAPAAGITGFNKEQLHLIVTAFEKRQTVFESMMSER